SDPRIKLVRSYGGGTIVVGEQQLTQPFIIFPDHLVLDWRAASILGLDAEQAQALCAPGTAIVLLGAGEGTVLPDAGLRTWFRARGISLECMNLGAACRTYNILANEGRPVAAGLFP
ncbi:MAG TPA: MTH938/NDUFAF3 family protein, partial [Steroidobacteraceae bacterium]|nr:MTH938/NDUFAF3 family protein [Steroidobacteraceae bacterium]